MKYTVTFCDDETWLAAPRRIYLVEAETVAEAFYRALDATGWEQFEVVHPMRYGQRVKCIEYEANVAPYDPDSDDLTDIEVVEVAG